MGAQRRPEMISIASMSALPLWYPSFHLSPLTPVVDPSACTSANHSPVVQSVWARSPTATCLRTSPRSGRRRSAGTLSMRSSGLPPAPTTPSHARSRPEAEHGLVEVLAERAGTAARRRAVASLLASGATVIVRTGVRRRTSAKTGRERISTPAIYPATGSAEPRGFFRWVLGEMTRMACLCGEDAATSRGFSCDSRRRDRYAHCERESVSRQLHSLESPVSEPLHGARGANHDFPQDDTRGDRLQ